MLYQNHEILGTDKPIFKEKEEDHYTYEEVLHLNGNLNDFIHVGYVKVQTRGHVFFEPVYRKRY
ncbi:MAG TPA: hypothetical protein VEY70_08720 [Metabacillus sp.]|nr:hypothetical protein [Metabacillus sp.]